MKAVRDPTPEEILTATKLIQESWDDRTERLRRMGIERLSEHRPGSCCRLEKTKHLYQWLPPIVEFITSDRKTPSD